MLQGGRAGTGAAPSAMGLLTVRVLNQVILEDMVQYTPDPVKGTVGGAEEKGQGADNGWSV